MSTSSPTREQQITSAKQRLLALLDGAKAVAQSTVDAASTSCPKCGTAGFNSEMWCGGCGYCPKTGYEGSPVAVDEEPAGELSIWRLVPRWLWMLLIVDLVLIGGAFYVSWAIDQHRERTLISASVLALSSLLIIVSHFRAFFRTLSTRHSVGTFDIIMKPMTIWREVARDLPATSYLFCRLAWGVTGAIMSFCVIGGLDYESLHEYVARDKPAELPSASTIAGGVIKGAAAMQTEGSAADMQSMMSDIQETAVDASTAGGHSPENIEEAISELGNATPMSGVNEAAGGLDQDPVDREGEGITDEARDDTSTDESAADGIVTCVIVGVTVNAAGEPRSLLLAAPIAGDWRYVARLPVGDVPREVMADLAARFPRHRSHRPLVPCPFGGQWLTPEFFCEIHFPTSPTGLRFDDPTFVKIQEAEQDRPR